MPSSNATKTLSIKTSRSRVRDWKLLDFYRRASRPKANQSDLDAALFSIKCFVAAMLSLYLSLRIGLTRPFWALGTVYLVSQPLSGMVISRGFFRFLGTLAGSTVTVLLVPALVNEPLVLSTALAIWIGFCLYIARLDRTPRAYAFQLAGYTTSLIGFPYVMDPGTIFTVASIRVQEITIGILCATLVHSLVLPRKVSHRVHTRVSAVLADSERWTRDMLGNARDAVLALDRARSAVDMLDLHQLSTHLPFDSVHGPLQGRILQALYRRLLSVLSLSGAIDDALIEMHTLPHDVPAILASLFEQVQSWLNAPDGMLDPTATRKLLDGFTVLRTSRCDRDSWHDLLLGRLTANLSELVLAHQDCRLLEQHLQSANAHWTRDVPKRVLDSKAGYALHRDHWLAARSAIGAVIGITISCALWIASAWRDGATAVSLVGVACALFGVTDQPAGSLNRYVFGSLAGVAVGLAYGFVILPRTTDFISLIAVLSPALLLVGALLARPQYTLIALGIVLNFPVVAGLGSNNAANFSSAVNAVAALLIGSGMAAVSLTLFQTIGTGHSTGRILQAIRRDVARRASGRATDMTHWTSRMVDRIGLLVPRLSGQGEAIHLLRGALADIRTGNTAGQLRTLAKHLDDRTVRACLDTFLDHLVMYFRKRELARIDDLLIWLDTTKVALAANATPASIQALLLLSDLRRDLLVRAIPSTR
jgi:uncharacterized membrane protein YccC